MKRTQAARRVRLDLVDIRLHEKVYAAVPDANCKGLCHEACGVITMSEFEFDRITARTGREPAAKDGTLTCPLLTEDRKCSVYDIRPLMCRLYGSTEKMPCPFGCVPSGPVVPNDVAMGMMAETQVKDGNIRIGFTHTYEQVKACGGKVDVVESDQAARAKRLTAAGYGLAMRPAGACEPVRATPEVKE